MNIALDRLAMELELESPTNARLRLEFGHACAQRVKHFLEEPTVLQCLLGLGQYLEGTLAQARFEELVSDAARLASQHPGSGSIDGVGHAAVSATYAVANALAGKARQAADYSAYASVYGQGGYGAVADRRSFEPEFSWQAGCLSTMARQRQQRESAA